MSTIIFANATGLDINFAFSVNAAGIQSFRLPADTADSRATASMGDTVYFWWRADENQIVQCFEGGDCAVSSFVMPDYDETTIQVSNSLYPPQTR